MAYYEDIIINDDGRTMCDLCEMYLENNTLDLHLNSKKHKDLTVSKIMLQNSITLRDNRGYCSICKVNMSDLINHIQCSQHQSLMYQIKAIVEEDGAFLELPVNTKESKPSAHCTICDGYVDYSLETLKDHIGSLRHKRARAMAVQPYNGIFSVEGSDDDLWCKICQVYFENYIEIIFEHVDEDKEHNVRLTKILGLIEGQNITIDKYLTNATEDKATCNKCNIEVSCNIDNLARHIKGKKHNPKTVIIINNA